MMAGQLWVAPWQPQKNWWAAFQCGVSNISLDRRLSDSVTSLISCSPVHWQHLLQAVQWCTETASRVIKGHNTALLNPKEKDLECKCRAECPLDGKWRAKNVVYEATVRTADTTKKYVGLTARQWVQDSSTQNEHAAWAVCQLDDHWPLLCVPRCVLFCFSLWSATKPAPAFFK